ncbi:beta-ketoacyl synthase N-terminal-like domain-containing protein [Streptomyces sp. NPDC101150]|uniref:beta-ketoacyl synthase N-terminal-like domain-containing protein n=1 Tax=Streptomyces sp. NPDC101150 TaxID=3366114 RepID=UPI0038016695
MRAYRWQRWPGRGPGCSWAACASSLTAVHLACAAPRAGECDAAPAGAEADAPWPGCWPGPSTKTSPLA